MNYENIPNDLKLLDQWVNVKNDSKIPICPFADFSASASDPKTWGTFEETIENIDQKLFEYAGFVFSSSDDFIGIDIDAGKDSDGFISELACDCIGLCQSYTELSKSGRGFHIIVKGKLPFKGKNNQNGLEIYQSNRYFVMTGETFLYDTIVENQSAIDTILEKYFSDTTERTCSTHIITNRFYTPIWNYDKHSGKLPLKPQYPEIKKGSRNQALASLAGTLHTQNYTKKQIKSTLSYVNSVACEKPLIEDEINQIVKSITKYKHE